MRPVRNVATADRIGRFVIGGSLVAFALLGLFPGPWGIALAVAGALVGLTGVAGYCPAYTVLRLAGRAPASEGTGVGEKGTHTG